MEGDHVTMVAADGVTETEASDEQTRAYKADAMAQNYLMLCLKKMPGLYDPQILRSTLFAHNLFGRAHLRREWNLTFLALTFSLLYFTNY